MNPINHEGGGLVDQDRALDSYLDALLYEQLDPVHDVYSHEVVQGGTHDVAAAAVMPEALADESPGGYGKSLDAVIFTVDGLRLALPAEKLARIVDFPAEILPAGCPQPWHVGRCVIEQAVLDIIDPAEIVIPSSHRVRTSDERRHDMRHLLLIAATSWALACQEVETVTLDTAQIHWRTAHTRRRWLAGTVMSHGCGLLDVDGLLRQPISV